MDLLRLLSVDGTLVGAAPIDVAETRRLFAAMVTARVYDRKGSALQRQGRLATYAQFEGQEAAQIGSAAALRADDWMVGTYRDAAAMWFHGYTWDNLLLGRMGDERGGAPPAGVNILPPSITVGAHMIHAVGLGWAERLRGSDRVALTYFGDGATSEGDFHEAMNFAAVFVTPTVFVCENNGWAISLPRARQTASQTIAEKATAYGMPGVLVDGNDVLAMVAATGAAVDRARRGEGPTLIEALTYRMGPHTTADDAGRYRPGDDVEEWRTRDPIDRVRQYLQGADGWDQGWEDDIAALAGSEIEAAVERAESLGPLSPDAMFDRMYARPTAVLEDERRAMFRDEGTP
ncbi:MAG: pyruvate dehydrogenase (acetyl-transferring) E1 component subunit alpha [Actinobacteria bacterium RBG_16_67_15]|nr:MAG: pyruvate dehydrogenase (acetyl-transferring) E1 component subunit alpha [Actinobacteria bacterium RBG_16_67_15]